MWDGALDSAMSSDSARIVRGGARRQGTRWGRGGAWRVLDCALRGRRVSRQVDRRPALGRAAGVGREEDVGRMWGGVRSGAHGCTQRWTVFLLAWSGCAPVERTAAMLSERRVGFVVASTEPR